MKTATPPPLRATPAVLADWAATVERARRSHYPTILIEPSLIVAIGRELEILRSRMAFRDSQRAELPDEPKIWPIPTIAKEIAAENDELILGYDGMGDDILEGGEVLNDTLPD